MDALSTLLEEIHLKGANYYYLHGHGDWQFRLSPPEHLMVFYIVLSGSFYISISGEKITAQTGDMLMLPRSLAHSCHTATHTAAHSAEQTDIQPIELIEKLPTNADDPIQLGNGFINTQAIMVMCEYDQDMAKPLLNALPAILPEPKQTKQKPPASTPTHGMAMGFNAMHFDIHSEILKIGLAYLSLETRTNRMGKATMINRLISMLMVECLREYIENLQETSDNWLLALTDTHLAKALSTMHAKPAESWSIASLAEIAGMSRSSFAEKFKTVVGEPPLSYLSSYRLRLAARFLRMEQYSIGRISELVGYASDSTFSQAFKREYGVSPMQYRQKFVHKAV